MFCFVYQANSRKNKAIWSGTLCFATSESDFTSYQLKHKFLDHTAKNEVERSSLAYSLSFAHAKSDFTHLLLTDSMKKQLSNTDNVLKENHQQYHEPPLPQTLSEAIDDQEDAIVITEINCPFKITYVNAAWEQLCGFRREECLGKTLKIIQGPETDSMAITALMSQLLRGETAGTLLNNYDKYGRKFRNRLRVGPIFSDYSHSEVTHFVGVLREV